MTPDSFSASSCASSTSCCVTHRRGSVTVHSRNVGKGSDADPENDRNSKKADRNGFVRATATAGRWRYSNRDMFVRMEAHREYSVGCSANVFARSLFRAQEKSLRCINLCCLPFRFRPFVLAALLSLPYDSRMLACTSSIVLRGGDRPVAVNVVRGSGIARLPMRVGITEPKWSA